MVSRRTGEPGEPGEPFPGYSEKNLFCIFVFYKTNFWSEFWRNQVHRVHLLSDN